MSTPIPSEAPGRGFRLYAGVQRRRRWNVEQKRAIILECYEPGASVSLVARRHDINPSQLFQWKRLYETGGRAGVTAGEEVVPASEMRKAVKKIHQLQRLLGKVTEEKEILAEMVRIGRGKNWILSGPLPVGEDSA